MRTYSLVGTALLFLSTATSAAPHVSVHAVKGPADSERNDVHHNDASLITPASRLINLDSREECPPKIVMPQSIVYQELTREELYDVNAAIVRKHTDLYSKGKLGKRRVEEADGINETVSDHLDTRADGPGPDPLTMHNPPVWPFITVGKLRFHSPEGLFWECTGTLVGRRHVLTSPACVKNGAIGQFKPGFDNPGNTNGQRFGYGRVERVLTVKKPVAEPKTDCADQNMYSIVILRETEAIGEQVGYLGLRSPDKAHFRITKRSLVTISYPGLSVLGGDRPFRMTGISGIPETSFLCDATGPLITDIGRWRANGPGVETISQGQGGMPIWEKEGETERRWIYGVLGYAFRNGNADYDQTVFAGGKGLLGMVAYAKERWP